MTSNPPEMKAVLQRVLSSSVTVNDQVVSAIGKGILVLAAIGPDDTKKDAESMASKVLKMKLWPDENEKNWKKSVQDIEGEVLCVSQFTLFASTKKGSKPDFHGAAKPEIAKELYDHFLSSIRAQYPPERVKDGVFQAMMQVALVNDGPVCSPRAKSLSATLGECRDTKNSRSHSNLIQTHQRRPPRLVLRKVPGSPHLLKSPTTRILTARELYILPELDPNSHMQCNDMKCALTCFPGD